MTASTNIDALAAETFAERRRLAGLLAGLTPAQWAHPSLCSGWRVREVVAHITLPYRHSGPRVIGGIIAARGRFNVFADRIARRDTERIQRRRAAREPRAEHAASVEAARRRTTRGAQPRRDPWPRHHRAARAAQAAGGTRAERPRRIDEASADVLRRRSVRNAFGGRRLRRPYRTRKCRTTLRMPAADMLLVVTGRRVLPGAP